MKPRRRALAVAPHPDDEAAGLTIALSRLGRRYERFVVYATTGVRGGSAGFGPAGERGVRERRGEAVEGMRMLGIPEENLIFLENGSWSLHNGLHAFARELERIAAAISPEVIFSPAVEHAHPDHDSARAAAEGLRLRGNAALLEYALYSSPGGTGLFNEFASRHAGTALNASRREAAMKAEIISCYRSQGEILSFFSKTRESVRHAAPLEPGGIIPKEPVFGEVFSDWKRRDVITAYESILEFAGERGYW